MPEMIETLMNVSETMIYGTDFQLQNILDEVYANIIN